MYKKGDLVILEELPTGQSVSEGFPWDVGQQLTVNYIDGCCCQLTDGKAFATINQSRISPLKNPKLDALDELSALDQELGLY